MANSRGLRTKAVAYIRTSSAANVGAEKDRVCGETGEVLREPMQRLLLGPEGQHGTGAIPRSALLDVVPARGLAELADTIRVQHVSGGVSTIALKSYAQGRERFQGATGGPKVTMTPAR
jgi:hypothetical protein